MKTTIPPHTANVLAAHKSHLQTVRHLRFRTMIKCLEKPCNNLFSINVLEIIFNIKYVFYKDFHIFKGLKKYLFFYYSNNLLAKVGYLYRLHSFDVKYNFHGIYRKKVIARLF